MDFEEEEDISPSVGYRIVPVKGLSQPLYQVRDEFEEEEKHDTNGTNGENIFDNDAESFGGLHGAEDMEPKRFQFGQVPIGATFFPDWRMEVHVTATDMKGKLLVSGSGRVPTRH